MMTLRIEDVFAAASNTFNVPSLAGRSKSISLSFGVTVNGLATTYFRNGLRVCSLPDINTRQYLTMNNCAGSPQNVVEREF